MKAFRLAVGFALVLGITSCGSEADDGAAATSMPDVVGLTLDVALSDIVRAGIEDEVEILGGGMFGVIEEGNWEVCDQLPAAGETVTEAPRLTVDRECEGNEPEPTAAPTEPEATTSPTAPEPTTAPTTAPTEPEPTTAPTVAESEEVLTVENSADLAALLAGPGECDDSVAEFARNYAGRVIEFDGNVAFVSNHDGQDTRFDYLIYGGDFDGEIGNPGPSFQFEDVNFGDLNLVGSNIPEEVPMGTNLRVVAEVQEFTDPGCLLRLDPIETEAR